MNKNFLSLAILMLLFSACKKEATNQTEMNSANQSNLQTNIFENSAANKERIRASLDLAAQTFSKLVANAEVRSLIKQKTVQRFDGDYDFLYSKFKLLKLSNGNTIDQELAALNPNFPAIAAGIPKFNISVPVECDKWNTAGFIPNVAVQAFGLDEKTLTTIKTYKANGAVELMDAKKDPTVPVIVLGVCERVDINEKLRPEFLDNTTTARVSGCNEITEKIKCPDLGAIESWTSGAPEIWQTVYGYNSASNVNPNPVFSPSTITRQFYKPSKRKDVDNRDWYVNRNLFYWYTNPDLSTSVYADATTQEWLEEDYFVPGGGIDLTLSIPGKIEVIILGQKVSFTPGLSATFHIEDDDDDCGSNTVHFLDPITNIYTTGLITWKEKN